MRLRPDARNVAAVLAIVICNCADSDPGFVGEHLEQLGYRLERLHREDHGEWNEDVADDADLLLLLGSDWSVYWDHVKPAVAAEVALVQRRMAADRPVLAICFGAQLACTALGGSVERAAEAEVGWRDVGSRHAAIEPGPWMQWHYDVCRLPDHVELLAANEIGPQAFRRGRLLATQFHPEATSAVVQRWSSGSGGEELVRLGIEREELLARTAAETPRSADAAGRLVDWFVSEMCR
ncbi:MAG: type 1 glutamine amidotransferase [Acidimicrobiia bacterium]